MTGSGRVNPPWQPRLLGLFMFLGLALRLAYVQQIETPPFSDMADYETMALNFLEGRGFIMSDLYRAYRPPLLPMIIALVYSVAGTNAENVRVLQCILSTVTVGLIYLLGRRLAQPMEGRFDPRTVGLIAAGLFCFEETSVFFCGQLLTETVFTLLVVAWAYALVRGAESVSFGLASIAGLCAGLAILARPNFGPVVLLGAAWLFFRNRETCAPPASDWRGFRLIASPYAPPFVLLLICFLVVSTWTIRNRLVLGHLVPVSTNGGVNFYLGHHEGFGYASFGVKEDIRRSLRLRGSYDEVEESRAFVAEGLKFIRENPGETIRNTLRKVAYLYWSPSSWQSAVQPWKWFSFLESPYRPWPWESGDRAVRFWPVRDERGRTILPTHQAPFWKEGRLPLVFWSWPVIYLVVLGIAVSLRAGPLPRFPLWLILGYTFMLLVFFTNSRFRFPLLPFLYFYAAIGTLTLAGLFSRSAKTEPNSDLTGVVIPPEVPPPQPDDSDAREQ